MKTQNILMVIVLNLHLFCWSYRFFLSVCLSIYLSIYLSIFFLSIFFLSIFFNLFLSL